VLERERERERERVTLVEAVGFGCHERDPVKCGGVEHLSLLDTQSAFSTLGKESLSFFPFSFFN
jgi:hypothetical protein